MKKQILTLLLLIASSFSFADNNIPLIMDDPLGDLNDRSVVGVYIQAGISYQTITVLFQDYIASQILITDSNNQTVFSQSYNPSYSVQADLSSLSSASYTLYIYAYDTWWHGTFAIE